MRDNPELSEANDKWLRSPDKSIRKTPNIDKFLKDFKGV